MIDLQKVQATAPDLVKHAEAANRSLKKRHLIGSRAQVAVILDHSGSMRRDYKNGSMQRLVEKLLGLSSQLDEDGAVDFFVFDAEADFMGQITLENYEGAVERLIGTRHMGTTNYAAAFRAVARHYAYAGIQGVEGYRAAKGDPGPVFALFLTDGAPNSRKEAERELKRFSAYPMFWKFLSIGNEPIPFLEKLDDLKDRVIDNADYKPLGDVDAIATPTLMEHLLDEYDGFIWDARQHDMI